LNSTAVFLIWSSPTLPYGVITSYTITYNLSSNDTQDIRLAGNETTNYTVQGVNEDTIYRFAVYASTRIGAGPSDEVTARTDEYCKLSMLTIFQILWMPSALKLLKFVIAGYNILDCQQIHDYIYSVTSYF